MSNPSNSSESGRVSGRRSSEKSNFSQTCSLLSQYLKEKGSFGDLRLGNPHSTTGKTETFRATTMNLLPKMDIPGDVSERKDAVSERMSERNVKSIDLFPPRPGLVPSVPTEIAQMRDDLSGKTKVTTVPGKSQMTIFYAGRVLVFDDFPADKAKEIMMLASKSIVQNSCTPSTSGGTDGGNSNFASTSYSNPPQDHLQQPTQADASDLPIARKVSLHRFLEKRKGRISAKAPYQVNRGSPTPASQPTGSKSWLGLSSNT